MRAGMILAVTVRTMAILSLDITDSARAEDVVIDTATTEMNGYGLPVQAGDTIHVTPTGSITTTQNNRRAIITNSGALSATNEGSILTFGTDGSGIHANTGLLINNSGTITTHGYSAEGIRALGSVQVFNSGSIQTLGEQSPAVYLHLNEYLENSGTIHSEQFYGVAAAIGSTIHNSGTISTNSQYGTVIAVEDHNSIFNTGIITASQDYSSAVSSIDIIQPSQNDYNTLINSGNILTTGSHAPAVIFSIDSSIENSGLISTTGDDAAGIRFDSRNTLIHTGSVLVAGAGSHAIEVVGDDNILTVHGTLISEQGYALSILGTGNTLNLDSDAKIVGAMALSESTIVNLAVGAQLSIVRRFDGLVDTENLNVQTSMPWGFNAANGVFTTFETSGLAAPVRAIGDLTASIGNLAHKRSRIAPSGRAVWVSGFGGAGETEGGRAGIEIDHHHAGFAIGADRLDADWGIGAMFGIAGSHFAASGSHQVSGDDLFAGLYGWRDFSPFTVGLTLAAGWSEYRHSRWIGDPLAPDGQSIATGQYGGGWISPSVELGLPLRIDQTWTVTPVIGARHAIQWLGRYSETGAATAASHASVGPRRIGLGEIHAGLEVDASIPTRLGIAQWQLYGGVSRRSSLGSADVSLTLNGDEWLLDDGGKRTDSAYLGGSMALELGNEARLELSGEAMHGRNGQHQASLALALSGRF